jgi:hypothetical protein
MRVLASRIVEALETANHCAVYETDLERFWPVSLEGREAKIARFAEANGLRLRFYKAGLCAIFDRRIDGDSAANGTFGR